MARHLFGEQDNIGSNPVVQTNPSGEGPSKSLEDSTWAFHSGKGGPSLGLNDEAVR